MQTQEAIREKELTLPMLPSSALLPDVLRRMHAEQLPGVISETGVNIAVLFTFDELLTAWEENLKRTPMHDLRLRDLVPHSRGLDLHRRFQELDATGRHFESQRAHDQLMDRGLDYAILLGSGEEYRVQLGPTAMGRTLLLGPVMCRCRRDDRHLWRPASLLEGRCRLDNSEVDCN